MICEYGLHKQDKDRIVNMQVNSISTISFSYFPSLFEWYLLLSALLISFMSKNFLFTYCIIYC